MIFLNSEQLGHHRLIEHVHRLSSEGLVDVEKPFLCPHCLDPFMTAEGLVVHIQLLHPVLMACLVNTSIGASCYANRNVD
jgi:hypothetical protein